MSKVIAVTGKGGTGKTIIAALTIRHLKENTTGPILAIDADPDANLGCVLGIPAEKTIGDLREKTLKEMQNLPAGLSKEAYIEAGLHEIVTESNKVDLLTMGRGEGPGCYCYVNNLLRKFSEKLHSAYQWVVVDNEAGLEHLSRQTTSKVDFLLVVVTMNPLSIDCAVRIDKLVSEFKNDVRRRCLLINDVRNEADTRAVLKKTSGLKMEYVGSVPHDDALEDAIFHRKPLFTLEGSKAVERMSEIVSRLRKEAGE